MVTLTNNGTESRQQQITHPYERVGHEVNLFFFLDENKTELGWDQTSILGPLVRLPQSQ